MKKAVDFADNRVQTNDDAVRVENQLVSELLISHLSGKVKGDLIEIPLPKGQILKLEVLEEGLYSGWIQNSENNDIIHEITKQTFQQVVDNVVAKHVELREDKKEVEVAEKVSEEVQSPNQIIININLSKSIDEFINMTKSHNKETYKMENSELKDLVKSILEFLPEQIDEQSIIKSYKMAREHMSADRAVKLIKSIVDQKYPQKIEKSEDKKVFVIGEDNENIAKSIDTLKEIGNDIVDFSSWDDDLTEQQEIIKSNIQSYIKEDK